MEALNFIKTYHKEYLDKSKIDNNVYDNENHNYEYYYSNFILSKKLLNLNVSNDNDIDLLICSEPITNNLIVPIVFNNFRFINLLRHNLIFDDNFNNIEEITGYDIKINGEMNNLKNIHVNYKLTINNKTSLNNIDLCFCNKYVKIIFNYEINNIINLCELFECDLNILDKLKLKNNTNKKIIINSYNFGQFEIKPLSKLIFKKGKNKNMKVKKKIKKIKEIKEINYLI